MDTGPRAYQSAVPLRAILCHDDPEMRDAVAATIERAGFVLVGKTERGLEAVGLAGDVRPDVAVIHLALLGTLGLRLIPTLQAAAPGCLVVVLSPLDTLVVPALEAGAHAVVAENDVLGLAAELGAIARSRLSPA